MGERRRGTPAIPPEKKREKKVGKRAIQNIFGKGGRRGREKS